MGPMNHVGCWMEAGVPSGKGTLCDMPAHVRRSIYSKLPARRGTVVERRSLTGELSLSCARPAADG